MSYQVIIPKRIEKTILKLETKTQHKIISKLKQLAIDPFSPNINLKPMQGTKSIYRIRIGKIRIVFDVFKDKQEIHLLKVGFRGDVYKR